MISKGSGGCVLVCWYGYWCYFEWECCEASEHHLPVDISLLVHNYSTLHSCLYASRADYETVRCVCVCVHVYVCVWTAQDIQAKLNPYPSPSPHPTPQLEIGIGICSWCCWHVCHDVGACVTHTTGAWTFCLSAALLRQGTQLGMSLPLSWCICTRDILWRFVCVVIGHFIVKPF